MFSKLWATLEKKNHIYYEQAPEKVALFLLPPYSPEYNPIEKTWAHIKKHLKKSLFGPTLVSINYISYKNKRIKGVIFLNPKVLILDVVRNLQSFAPFLVDSELSAYKGNLLEVPQRPLA